MQEFEYFKPQSINEAIELLDKYGRNLKVLAGGTDLIIALREKLINCKYIMDIKAIEELKQISYSEAEGLSIGAAVCLNEIITSEKIVPDYSILVQAAKTLANSLLRNRATLIGNLCNASPGGDMLSPSIVLEGEAEIVSKHGTRRVPLKGFFTGVKKTVLVENELVTRVIYPSIKGKGIYLRKSRIKGHDLAQIGVAAFVKEAGGLNITIGAAGPTPVFIEGFDKILKQELRLSKEIIIDKVLKDIKPISDQRASKEFRTAMAKYLTAQILEELGKEE